MKKDYHLHPNLIRSPMQAEAFIDAAIKKGIGEICFTDHMPLSISNASDRLPKGSVKEYCGSVREISKRYEGKITVKCGIEIDFHPSVRDEIDRVLDEGSFDFVLGSSHMHVFVKDFTKYTHNDFAEASLENSILAAESGLFNAISHLDMYRFVFENSQRFPLKNDGYDILKHEGTVRSFLKLIAEKGILLEINPHLAEGKGDISFAYPQADAVRWAIDEGCLFSYGSDAHAVQSVGAFLDELRESPVYSHALKKWEGDAL